MFAALFGGIAVIALFLLNTYALYVFAWGLHVQSWWALIGFGLIGPAVLRMMAASIIHDIKRLL